VAVQMSVSHSYKPLFHCLLLAFLMGFSGCRDNESSIPDMPVYLMRDINVAGLRDPGTYLYVSTPKLATDRIGYGGLLIVHSSNVLNGSDGFCAFDLSCPVEHKWDVRIRKPDQNLICVCDSCGEKYDLKFGDGTPTNNISREPLRRYNVRVDYENNTITVFR
jgi:hypothetical protein